MLTIKHVERGGFECVTSAAVVEFIPAALAEPSDLTPHDEVIAFGVPQPVSDGCNRYQDGTIYVMNDHGSTIATYHLGDPPTPK